jgi:hypothetical protein
MSEERERGAHGPERETTERHIPARRGPLRLVVVRWHDAWFDFEVPGRFRTQYPVQTVGFLIREDDEVVSVAQELLPSGDGFRAITHIPRGVVQAITTLFEEGGPARRAGDQVLARDP